MSRQGAAIAERVSGAARLLMPPGLGSSVLTSAPEKAIFELNNSH